MTMNAEQHADNIARWTNAGLRQAVIDEIERAVLAEREACAKIAEERGEIEHDKQRSTECDMSDHTGYNIAAAIRARADEQREDAKGA
jgi:hypothetical protein